MSRSRHQRNAVSVFPVPVGARMSVLSPRAIAGQPRRCGAVGRSKTARNHCAVTGWKSVRAALFAAVTSGIAFEPAFAVLPGDRFCRLLRSVSFALMRTLLFTRFEDISHAG